LWNKKLKKQSIILGFDGRRINSTEGHKKNKVKPAKFTVRKPLKIEKKLNFE